MLSSARLSDGYKEVVRPLPPRISASLAPQGCLAAYQ